TSSSSSTSSDPRDRASWPGGVAAPVRKGAKAPKWRRRGGGSGSKTFLLILNHHPVRSIKGGFAIFLLIMRPPLLARRGHHTVTLPNRSAFQLNLTPPAMSPWDGSML